MSGLDAGGYANDAGFLDLENVASPAHPDGRTYRVLCPSWPDARALRRIVMRFGGNVPDRAEVDGPILEDLTRWTTDADGNPMEFDEKLLGPALAEMVADEVPTGAIDRIVQLTMIHFGANEHLARQIVADAAGEAEARANRATRRAAIAAPTKRPSSPRKAGSKSSRASGAKSTPPAKAPASTRGRATSATPSRTRKAG